jgi:asparagine synthetase B (glutamine-hydrolysing)
MCGILGYSHISRELPSGVLTSGLNSLVHRGPDHQGRFVSGQISFGATRLRILDLEAGDQPLLSPDKDVVVVFNGEIFNHREIRTELEAEGFRHRGRPARLPALGQRVLLALPRNVRHCGVGTVRATPDPRPGSHGH